MDADLRERLLRAAQADAAQREERSKEESEWQRVRVWDAEPPVPWSYVDFLHDLKRGQKKISERGS